MTVPDGKRMFIGDGGLETTMIFREGLELPEFASFPLLGDSTGRKALRHYYDGFIDIATEHGVGFILDTPTWRASEGWGGKLGFSAKAIADVNRDAVEFGAQIRAEREAQQVPIVICGAIGPEGDAYHPERALSPGQAEEYHSSQIGVFAAEGADMVGALTLTYTEEAIGIVRAAAAAHIPVSISFTVETDGRLPSEEPLQEAMERLDAETEAAPAYLMINCAHPSHFASELSSGGAWLERIGGIRANASRKSHEELDTATELDSGDPDELGGEYKALEASLPSLRVLGGCCGTDKRHIASICEICL
jgi:homocysteine S-methyltransferase